MFDFLRQIPVFRDFPPKELEQLCLLIETCEFDAGDLIFAENSPGDRVYLIEEGEVEIVKDTAGHEVLLVVRQRGDVIGEISLLDGAPRIASARARTPVKLLSISREQLDSLIDSNPTIAHTLLQTVTRRLRETNIKLRESEKLAQLGTLTAGIAHELNNPAAAVQRGASRIVPALDAIATAEHRLDKLDITPAQRQKIIELQQLATQRAKDPPAYDPITASDREQELEIWLTTHHFNRAGELAATLTEMGIERPFLEDLDGLFSMDTLEYVLVSITDIYQGYQLADEIEKGARQISEIVKVLKSYVYLDQAPVVPVDIHQGIRDTLVLLRSKLKQKNMTVHTDFCSDLPKIEGHGSELNQVWTNLIDNAIDAMGEGGEITIRTRTEPGWAIVEVEDHGPGIPEEIQSHIFDLFFTTKPQGVGSGLGLPISQSIVQNHKGLINLRSKPGETVFEVWLPLEPEKHA